MIKCNQSRNEKEKPQEKNLVVGTEQFKYRTLNNHKE